MDRSLISRVGASMTDRVFQVSLIWVMIWLRFRGPDAQQLNADKKALPCSRCRRRRRWLVTHDHSLDNLNINTVYPHFCPRMPSLASDILLGHSAAPEIKTDGGVRATFFWEIERRVCWCQRVEATNDKLLCVTGLIRGYTSGAN